MRTKIIKKVMITNHGKDLSLEADGVSVYGMTEIVICREGDINGLFGGDLMFHTQPVMTDKTRIIYVGWVGRGFDEPVYTPGKFLKIVPVGEVYNDEGVFNAVWNEKMQRLKNRLNQVD